MSDFFALLDEPRRPWLDADALKDKFHKLSAAKHPDVAGGDSAAFAEINNAFRTLDDPKSRVRHLLDLEFPGVLAQHPDIPADIARVFETMTRERQGVARFLEARSSLQTPLEIALLAPEQLELEQTLARLLALLEHKMEGLLTQLKFVDAVWEQDKAGAQDTLIEIYQGLSYVGKWITQVREDQAKLSEN